VLTDTYEAVAAGQNLGEAVAADQNLQEAVGAYRAGKLDEVETLCNRTLEQQPDHIGSLQLLAAVAANRGVPRRGVELMEKAIALCPDSVDSHIELARLLRLEERNSDAIAALQKAIDIQPNSAGAYNDLGLIYLEATSRKRSIAMTGRSESNEISPLLISIEGSRWKSRGIMPN
jgi:tetratricopeptide (TPR) repeat protein